MIQELFNKHNAKKHPHFADIYDSWFCENRMKIKSVLEIGIYEGGSLRTWAEYFPNADIYGIDVKLREWNFPDRIKAFIGNQQDENFLIKTFGDKSFDIIIDDGGHYMKPQKKCLKILFKLLKPRGVYIIEDLHTSYWPGYGGGLKSQKTTIEKLKSYVDSINHKAIKHNKAQKNNYKVGYFEKNIESLHFYKSLCIIRKK